MTGTKHQSPPPRRLFAKRFLGEALSFIDEIRGRPQRRLSDLTSLPPEKLSLLKGAILRHVEMALVDEHLCVVSRGIDGSSESRPVMERTEANLVVFNQLTGDRTLGEIAEDLARQTGWEQDRALAHVTDLFFSLIREGICAPTNVVD